ncbi:hypothetical protein SGFS_099150 [Streptomyces graminofaciens]|uniref:Uncharacterized protein n=1 Tax=Streptomyces graminofaciens TaxID=68212 RepID=A0ABM7FPB1_9ACTN|nr:hypothetical protein SGFS_099150 [Streptomyces graminofaciens]
MGEQATAAIADMYQALSAQPDHSITAERSAQKLLGVTPRTASQWLAGIDLRPGSATHDHLHPPRTVRCGAGYEGARTGTAGMEPDVRSGLVGHTPFCTARGIRACSIPLS